MDSCGFVLSGVFDQLGVSLITCVFMCLQEGRGSRQEGMASEGAEEEEEDEEDDKEDQK